MSRRCPLALAVVALTLVARPAAAADWPVWRADGNRSAASPQQLPAKLEPQWVRHESRLTPAWPDQSMMPFDAAYEPVVAGKTLYFGSSQTDSVTAVDTATGEQKWRFDADGPVRFAPLVWEGRVYFVSDDGYLYCVNAATGALVWKFRGGPGDRKILGNERLISTWPARGAPVIADGTVYFAASIWPFMGIFIHALDARTGSVVWTNDGDGSIYMKQPHDADSFAGVAPQGPMAVLGDRLLVTGGRSVPACYDRRTGKLIHFLLSENSKKGGGSTVAAMGNVFVNGGGAFELASGKYLGKFPATTVLTPDVIYGYDAGVLKAFDLARSTIKVQDPPPSPKMLEHPGFAAMKALTTPKFKWTIGELASLKLPGMRCMIRAGSRLYLGLPNKIVTVALTPKKDRFTIESEMAVDGTPASLVAADDRLIVVTLEGEIQCYGGEKASKRVHHPGPPKVPVDEFTQQAHAILDTTRASGGYCVAWGVGSGRLITELARNSQLRIVAVEPDPAKAKAVRERLVAAGLYGERVAVHCGDPKTFEFPPYFATLMVSEDLAGVGFRVADFGPKILNSLRPYGGTACLPLTPAECVEFVKFIAQGALDNAIVKETPAGTLIIRTGAIPGAGNWTHEHADAANTRVSPDQVVKAPLGLLWFGGPPNDGILPRHGHGPQPQVIDGRLIIEGVDKLRALDIYTGRLLWEAPLKSLGAAYNNLAHQPGANAGGTNFISTPDGIYVAYQNSCIVLDPDTGRRITEHQIASDDDNPRHRWGYINVSGEFLVGGVTELRATSTDAAPPKPTSSGPAASPARDPFNWKKYVTATGAASSSGRLVVMDRHTGKVLWQARARYGFRHNAVCIGGGRLYAIDRPTVVQAVRTNADSVGPAPRPRLFAFDLKTGTQLWSTDADVFGTYLSYSAAHDVLIETGRVTRDALADEPKGMRAYRAGSGAVLWKDSTLVGPALLHGDTIIRDKGATDLLTGAPVKKPDPLTGEPADWTWARNYGCNTPAAAQHLMTFRSGAAGYCDLCNDSGTGNFGGLRSGCTNNLVVAGGIISVPDYTRTCTCSYQNQTSIALVPMADAEMWTSVGKRDGKGPVRRVGINFGAPGDRRADDGTLWLEYPSVGGASPVVNVRVKNDPVDYFRRHSSRAAGGIPWVTASGIKGVESVTLTLGHAGSAERRYTVKLHFAEPEPVQPGERVFNVVLQGRVVLTNLDVMAETGGQYRGLVKEFYGVRVGEELEVQFARSPLSKRRPVICGIEVIAERW